MEFRDPMQPRFAPRILLATALAAAALGLGLRGWPVGVGYFQDDALQIAMLEHTYPSERGPLDLFRLVDLERDGRALLDAGVVPWWSTPNLRIAMFRPLASALMALDYRVFGADPYAAHLHSVLWFVSGVAALALALGELFPPALVTLALLVYAVDEAHTLPLAWLANRSYLIAETFGWLGVWAHLRGWRRPGIATRGLEALCFSLALAGGEYAIAMLAYPVALELARAGQSARARLAGLVPSLGPGLLYLALRGALGFGERGSGYYLDPLAASGAYAHALLERSATLASILVLRDVDRIGLGMATPHAAWVIAGLAAGTILVAAAWWAGRHMPRAAQRALIALAAGALLSFLPTAGAAPNRRLLGAAAGGSAAVAAAVVVAAARRAASWRAKQPLAAIALATLSGLVLYFYVFEAAMRSRATLADFEARARAEWRRAQQVEIPEDPRARIFIVSGTDTSTNLPWVRRLDGHALPRSCWRLSPYLAPHQVRRVEDGVIEVQVGQSRALPLAGSFFRAADAPLATGDVIDLDGLRVTVLEALGGEPVRLRFDFAGSLDDPTYVFLQATPRGLQRMHMPAVGDKLRLASPAPPPIGVEDGS